MENKEYTGKKVLTDEELEKVAGGNASSADSVGRICVKMYTKEECLKVSVCHWENDVCKSAVSDVVSLLKVIA